MAAVPETGMKEMSGSMGGKNTKKKMNRKQVVMIEWAVLIGAVILGIVLGIWLLVSRLSAHKDAGSPQSASGTQNTQEGAADSGVDGAEQQDTEPATEALTEMEAAASEPKNSWLFSFAGDCTIGSLLEWQGSIAQDFQSVVGDDYAYPLSGVKSIFEADDLTSVNLEGTFTNSTNAVVKPYRFKADPAYVQVLKEGSVEAVSMANNHSGDFQDEGRADTIAALDSVGILHTGAGDPLIHEMEGGLKIGMVSYNTVDNYEGEYAWRSSVQTDINTCREAGCDLIIGFMHWGSVEYLTEPEAWEVQFAHDMVDWGCDLIVGGHAHILQRMEYYNNVPIFYSMGNFCYGGNTNPDDKDSVIVQAEFSRDSSGEVTLSRLHVIPCLISTRTDLNDYCPTPCQEGSEDYQRIVGRLEMPSADAQM